MHKINFIPQLELILTEHLGKDIAVEKAEQVYGGDINQTFVLQTNAGPYFLKTNNATYADMFEKEFNGLTLLIAAKGVRIPQPLCHGKIDQHIFLVMEFISKGNTAKDFWKNFTGGLAIIHRQTQKEFGLVEDNYIGSILQVNQPCDTWAAFYATQRILPLLKKAADQHQCTAEDVKATERFCSKLPSLLPEEQPSLLHGDLWSGNFMVAENGQPVIYDPAIYYGHREMDIAMTRLFGGFDQQFYQHYNEIFPLQNGWQQRVDIFQLYPLLVHLVLFGGHYYYNVMEIIKKYR